MASSGATPVFPHLVLDGLARHLSKLRRATTVFPSAPSSSLHWTASQGLQDALTLLHQNSDRVRDTATKFGLVLSSTTQGASIKAISDEMRQACDSLVASLGVLVEPVAGAGKPLMDIYCQQTRAILRAVEELIKHITSSSSLLAPGDRKNTGAVNELAPKTGVIWAQCEQLSNKLPRSNKVAYRRAILQHQAAVKDTLREFQEMLAEEEEEGTDDEEKEEEGEQQQQQQQQAHINVHMNINGVTQGMEGLNVNEQGEDNDMDFDEDDDFLGGGGGGDSLKPWEKENVARCLVALGHCSDLVKGLLEAIDESTSTETDTHTHTQEVGGEGVVMEAVAGIEESCQALTAAVVNAADALYPPQIRQELESQLGALVEAATHTSTTIQLLPPGGAVSRCVEAAERVKQASSVGVAEGTEGEEEEGGGEGSPSSS